MPQLDRWGFYTMLDKSLSKYRNNDYVIRLETVDLYFKSK